MLVKPIESMMKAAALSALVIFILSQLAVTGTYVSGFHQLGQLSFKAVALAVLLISAGIALILGAQGLIGIRNKQLAWLLPLVAWIFYFQNGIAFATAALLMLAVFCVGHTVTVKLNLARSAFVDFCLGHTLLAFLSWLIIRFAGFQALTVFQMFFAGLVIFSLYTITKLPRAAFTNARQRMANPGALERALLYAIAASYLIYATLYSFYFDDLNGYLLAPIRVYLDHGFHFGPDRPGFLTNMSALSLGYGGLLASVLGWDKTVFLFGFKYFHAASYFIGLVTLTYSFSLLRNHLLLRWIWLSVIGFLPLIVFELTGNYADYHVLLGAMFIAYQLAQVAFQPEYSETRAAILFEAVILGLFAIVSLKCIPYIMAYFFLKGGMRLCQRAA